MIEYVHFLAIIFALPVRTHLGGPNSPGGRGTRSLLVATTVTLAHVNFSSFPVCAGRVIIPSTRVAKIFVTSRVSLRAICFPMANQRIAIELCGGQWRN